MTESIDKLGRYRLHLLALILALTLVRGVLYAVLVPPWQHYDEPTHFEYVRLIAERRRIPEPGDYDLEMRRAIAASMMATEFWQGQGQDPPAIDLQSEMPPSIGISELGHPPLYFALLALPQLAAQQQTVETQLYLARLTSLIFYLVVVASAYGLVAEVYPGRQMLPVAVGAFVALLPPFTDLMSAVNNDAAANAAVSMLLWSSVRLIRWGASARRIGVTLLLVATCFLTKSTAQFVATAILPVLAVALLPHRVRRWGWAGLALLLPLTVLFALTYGGHAAYWLSRDQPAAPNRLEIDTILGQSAFALSVDGERHPRLLFQELHAQDAQDLRGNTITLGAWLRAGQGQSGVAALQVDEDLRPARHQRMVDITDDWSFHTMTATIGSEAPGVAVQIALPEQETSAEDLFVDGVVLVNSRISEIVPPQFETPEAAAGRWGSRNFTNLLRNASAEQTWPGLRPWLGNRNVLQYYPLTHIFYSVWDWKRTRWVYRPELYRLVTSFWGRFGWSHLVFPTAFYYPLRLVTLLAIVGCGLGLGRWLRTSVNKQSWQWYVLALLSVALIVGWGAVMLRLHPVLLTWWGIFWPDARYAFVVIAPTALAICYGLAEIVPRRLLGQAAWLGLLAMILLDLLALWTLILPHYYG